MQIIDFTFHISFTRNRVDITALAVILSSKKNYYYQKNKNDNGKKEESSQQKILKLGIIQRQNKAETMHKTTKKTLKN